MEMKDSIRREYRLERPLQQVLLIALARSPYKNHRQWAREQVVRLCLEYAPDDLEKLTGITEANHGVG